MPRGVRYDIMLYADHSLQLEIHRAGCQTVAILEQMQRDKVFPDCEPYEISGTLKDAVRCAAHLAEEQRYPRGWRKARCCISAREN